MTKKKCEKGCYRGNVTRECGQIVPIIGNIIQINGNEVIDTFSHCPRCGASLEHSVLLTSKHWEELLSHKYSVPRKIAAAIARTRKRERNK